MRTSYVSTHSVPRGKAYVHAGNAHPKAHRYRPLPVTSLFHPERHLSQTPGLLQELPHRRVEEREGERPVAPFHYRSAVSSPLGHVRSHLPTDLHLRPSDNASLSYRVSIVRETDGLPMISYITTLESPRGRGSLGVRDRQGTKSSLKENLRTGLPRASSDTTHFLTGNPCHVVTLRHNTRPH